MARSPDRRTLALAAVLLAGCVAPAAAAPSAEQKAERKQKRQENLQKREKKTRVQPQPDPPTSLDRRPPSAPSPAAPGDPPLPPCPPDNTLTWRSFGAGFLLTWCTGCHSSHLPAAARQDAPEDVNFDTHAHYKPRDRQVYARAVLEAHAFLKNPASASPMPPAGLPSELDRQRLAQWIACGSP